LQAIAPVGYSFFKDDQHRIHDWVIKIINEHYIDDSLKEMVLSFFNNAQAKKIRPLITYYMFKAIHGENEDTEAFQKLKILCAASEISHNASLIIDDVFDKDIVRRGKPAFHVNNGTFAALSAGYNLSTFVFDLITQTGNIDIMQETSKVGAALSSVLYVSKDLNKKSKLTRDYFFDLLYRKTSASFICSAKTPAILGNGNDEIIQLAHKFGEYFGIAYQLRDDVLAIIGEISDLGKPPQSDIINRFQSLITIEAMEAADENQSKILNEYYLDHKDYSVEEIKNILIQTGAVKSVIDLTLEYVKKARELLDIFKPSSSIKKLNILLNNINFNKYHQYLK